MATQAPDQKQKWPDLIGSKKQKGDCRATASPKCHAFTNFALLLHPAKRPRFIHPHQSLLSPNANERQAQ